MKTLNIIFDDETAKVLNKYPNKSEIVRNAVRLYDEYLTTDTKEGILRAFAVMLERLDKTDNLIRDRLPKVGDKIQPTSYLPRYTEPSLTEPIIVADSQDPADRPRDISEIVKEIK